MLVVVSKSHYVTNKYIKKHWDTTIYIPLSVLVVVSRPFYTAVVILMIPHCKVKMCWALRLWAIIAALSARVCSDTPERRAVLPGVTQRHGVTPRISTLDTQNTKHQSPPEFNVMSGCFTLEGDSTLYCHIFTFIKIIHLRCSICKK